jgi:DNA-binding NtrC family response regulator
VTTDDARALYVRVDRPLSEIAPEVEVAELTYALRAANGRMDRAAKRLGLSRKRPLTPH